MDNTKEIFSFYSRIILPDPIRRKELHSIYAKEIKNLTKSDFKLTYTHKKIKYTCSFKIDLKKKNTRDNEEYYTEVKVECKDSRYSYNNRSFCAEIAKIYLMQLFLIFNLSLPSCFEIYNRVLHHEYRYDVKVHLSSFIWMFYQDDFIKTNWPNIQIIPFTQTHKWFSELNIGLKQLAKSKLDYALFSLLNASSNEILPTNILWLAQCLEAIYDSPTDSILATLKRRIYLNLDKPNTAQNKINQKINNFYSLRSSIIHGNYNIGIPEPSEIFELEWDEQVGKYSDNELFIMSIIIASLQKYILNDCDTFTFAENIKYMRIA